MYSLLGIAVHFTAGNDSESAALTHLSRMNAELWAVKAGCVGYEIGGAQCHRTP